MANIQAVILAGEVVRHFGERSFTFREISEKYHSTHSTDLLILALAALIESNRFTCRLNTRTNEILIKKIVLPKTA